MKKFFSSVLIALCCTFMATAQPALSGMALLKYCTRGLSADSMCGRRSGTDFEIRAANFISERFKSLKIQPYYKNNYFHYFTYRNDSVNLHCRNVIASIDNKAGEYIVIGAHYDHLGLGGKRSRSYGKYPEVHNGADDNASGVALMLALAGHLKKNGNKNFNFLFVAFAGHEDGLFGSNAFVDSSLIKPDRVKLMINLDMVGRAEKTSPVFYCASSDSATSNMFFTGVHCKQLVKSAALQPGDHTAFARKNIAVMFITSGMHDDYHKVSDDADKINFRAMDQLLRCLAGFIRRM